MSWTNLKCTISNSKCIHFKWFSNFQLSFLIADDFWTSCKNEQLGLFWPISCSEVNSTGRLHYHQPLPVHANPQHILTMPAIVSFCSSNNSEQSVLLWIIPWCCKYRGGLKSSFFWKYSSTQLKSSGWLPSALVGRWKSTNWHLKHVSPQKNEIWTWHTVNMDMGGLLPALATLPLGKEIWYPFSNLSKKTDVICLLE